MNTNGCWAMLFIIKIQEIQEYEKDSTFPRVSNTGFYGCKGSNCLAGVKGAKQTNFNKAVNQFSELFKLLCLEIHV